ncbi:MAG TPA: EAL domain-containing protein [Tepidisphaeraceae bacterium]|jgi:diguanylate cyclase (GGDEF)-like protein|nr:EAL domain-containing protein [Tepidisphaeraceae bacterium]
MPAQKLLIIDDSPEIHELVAVWLMGEPVEFVSCFTGEQGLTAAAAQRADLVLLDVDLGGVDGFEVCRQLKANPATADIPIVFLTGASSTEEKLRGLELGAIDYVTKPFDPAELRARVRSSLNTKQLLDLLAQKALVLQESEDRFRVLAYREQIRAQVLEMITQGQLLTSILRHLTAAAEHEDPAAMAAGVMLDAGSLYHCAPSLPPAIAASIERQLYTFITRFSALAAQSEERILVCDLLADPAWEELRPAIIEHGLRFCWAVPIRARQRDSGVFAFYRRDEQRPGDAALEMLKLAGSLVEVAVEHHHLNQQLTFQAQHDALTQLPNRVLFSDRLQHALATAARASRPAAILLIDVDRFKYVNDTFGHQAGDEMLCQIAHRLQGRLRACDTLARMGGDEFAIILGEVADPNDALLVAGSLNDALKEPVDLLGRKQFVTISIGTASFPRDGTDAATLLKNADLALYRAKDDGRNTAACFTPEMGQGSAERMEIEIDLRQVLASGEMDLHYQPKMNPAGKIVSVEALLRWDHPRLGMIPPAKFIPVAEDTGMIIPVGTWVLQQAARQCRQWFDQGLGVIPIAVNVSALQFAQSDFVSIVSAALAIAALPGRWLEIELTETLLMRNMRDAGDKLSQLREMNVTVAVDDFGTGYSSLAYIERLSLDALKIDHSFVSAIEGPGPARRSPRAGGNGRKIIGAIIAMARSLGLQVIAEGVETETQRSFLVNSGCDLLQGFLFSHPADPEQIAAKLRMQTPAFPTPLARSA